MHLKSHWLSTAEPVQADVESDLQGSFQSVSDDTKDRPQSQSYDTCALQLCLKGTAARQNRL